MQETHSHLSANVFVSQYFMSPLYISLKWNVVSLFIFHISSLYFIYLWKLFYFSPGRVSWSFWAVCLLAPCIIHYSRKSVMAYFFVSKCKLYFENKLAQNIGPSRCARFIFEILCLWNTMSLKYFVIFLYFVILCNTLQYFVILCNTLQYFAILCNTLQYFSILCKTL